MLAGAIREAAQPVSHRDTSCRWAIKLPQRPPRRVASLGERGGEPARDSAGALEGTAGQDERTPSGAIVYPPLRPCPTADGSGAKLKVHILPSPIPSPGRGGTSKPSCSHPSSPGMLHLARNQPGGAVSEHTLLPAAPCFSV